MYQSEYRRPELSDAALLRGHCQFFSRIGWALFAQMLSSVAVQSLVLLVAMAVSPMIIDNPIFLWILSVGSAYGVGVPVCCLILRGAPTPAPSAERRPLGVARFLQVYLMGLGVMYLANYATLLLMWVIGLVQGEGITSPVESIMAYPVVLSALLGCVVAPVLEELVFRGLLLSRLRPYGERFAMVSSALAFGLFHGNLHQFFYAFAIGLVLAYVVLKTNCLWQTMLLHAMLNAIATLIVPLVEPLGEVGTMVLGMVILGAIFLGITFFITLRRRIFFLSGRYGFSEGRTWRLFFENPGVVCFVLLTALMAGSYLVVT